jgi:hypothetical protein
MEPSTLVTIESNDGSSITVPRGVLCSTSGLLRAMLEDVDDTIDASDDDVEQDGGSSNGVVVVPLQHIDSTMLRLLERYWSVRGGRDSEDDDDEEDGTPSSVHLKCRASLGEIPVVTPEALLQPEKPSLWPMPSTSPRNNNTTTSTSGVSLHEIKYSSETEVVTVHRQRQAIRGSTSSVPPLTLCDFVLDAVNPFYDPAEGDSPLCAFRLRGNLL